MSFARGIKAQLSVRLEPLCIFGEEASPPEEHYTLPTPVRGIILDFAHARMRRQLERTAMATRRASA